MGDVVELHPTKTCDVCGGPIVKGQGWMTLRIAGGPPHTFHNFGPCQTRGLAHGTRPLREDER